MAPQALETAMNGTDRETTTIATAGANCHTSNLPRRAMLAGAGVAAILPDAAAPTAASSGTDAALLRLAAELRGATERVNDFETAGFDI